MKIIPVTVNATKEKINVTEDFEGGYTQFGNLYNHFTFADLTFPSGYKRGNKPKDGPKAKDEPKTGRAIINTTTIIAKTKDGKDVKVKVNPDGTFRDKDGKTYKRSELVFKTDKPQEKVQEKKK